jgi:hypothetical protein
MHHFHVPPGPTEASFIGSGLIGPLREPLADEPCPMPHSSERCRSGLNMRPLAVNKDPRLGLGDQTTFEIGGGVAYQGNVGASRLPQRGCRMPPQRKLGRTST